jgi:hypothetical protein
MGIIVDNLTGLVGGTPLLRPRKFMKQRSARH